MVITRGVRCPEYYELLYSHESVAGVWHAMLIICKFILEHDKDYVSINLYENSILHLFQNNQILRSGKHSVDIKPGIVLITFILTSDEDFVTVYSTHLGRITHIYVNKSTIIGLDNGLSPGRRQAIIWTNAGILFIWPLE